MNMVINLSDGSERHFSNRQIHKVHDCPVTDGESQALSLSKYIAAGHGIVLELVNGSVLSFPARSIHFVEVTE